MISVLASAIVVIIGTGVSCSGLRCLPGYENTGPGNGHETLVAQIVQETCPDCQILPVKVYDSGIPDPEKVNEALDWLVHTWRKKHRNPRMVINMSLQWSYEPKGLRRRLSRLIRAGVPVVAAAGNGSTGAPAFPASLPGVISVGALEATGLVAYYSKPGDLYVFAREFDRAKFPRGTSYAAPVVSAVLAYAGGRR